MINNTLAQNVIKKCSLVGYINSYTTLFDKGNQMRGSCPLCKSKTKSFVVSEEKELWFCTDCGAVGNIIGFVMKVHELTYSQAVERLAAEYHIAAESFLAEGISDEDLLKSIENQISSCKTRLQECTYQYEIDNLLDRYSWLLEEKKHFIIYVDAKDKIQSVPSPLTTDSNHK
ncbi:CHC2 zinc finger domain-containing protein [Flavitalea sp.]|nr:CHC2 zinc finger domain-containing protein [Flavitalea sp.]